MARNKIVKGKKNTDVIIHYVMRNEEVIKQKMEEKVNAC